MKTTQNNWEAELEKAQKALDTEKNLNQISFYEGYIKGLSFIRSVEEKAEEEIIMKAYEKVNRVLENIKRACFLRDGGVYFIGKKYLDDQLERISQSLNK